MGGRYAVIVCPHCATPIGADLQKQTMTCICGQTIELLRIKPKFVSNSPLKVAEAVALAKSQVAEGKMDMPRPAPPKGKLGKIAAKARDIKDTQERIGRGSASDMLVAMREGGIVFECGKGKYKAV
jgi:hypothetical protein